MFRPLLPFRPFRDRTGGVPFRFFGRTGLSLFELILVLFLISTLSALAQPLFKNAVRREKERGLQHELQVMREAIDLFREDWEREEQTRIGPYCKRYAARCLEISGESGYPKTLETLLKVELFGKNTDGTLKDESRRYLRRVPTDPITRSESWGLRCYEDAPDSTAWCGKDVYDIHTTSPETALNQTPYAGW